METRKWTDKDGVERYTTEVIATDMKMLGSKPGSDSAQPEEDDEPAVKPEKGRKKAKASA